MPRDVPEGEIEGISAMSSDPGAQDRAAIGPHGLDPNLLANTESERPDFGADPPQPVTRSKPVPRIYERVRECGRRKVRKGWSGCVLGS